jgi:hypothetical protein
MQAAPRQAKLPYLDVAKENRIPNRTGSQCVFCAIETLARHHKITQLYDLTQKYRGPSGPGQVAAILKARGIDFNQRWPGQPYESFIKKACAYGYGCLVSVGHGRHAIACVGCDETHIYVIDNGPNRETQAWSWQRFRGTTDGWVCVIYPWNARK